MATTKKSQAPAFTLTKAGQRYNPRAATRFGHHTNWAAITGYLKAHGGKATLQQLTDVGATLPVQVQPNHVPYIKYAVRRGWLAPVQ